MWKHLWNLWENTISKSLPQNKPTRNNNVHSSADTHSSAHPSPARPGPPRAQAFERLVTTLIDGVSWTDLGKVAQGFSQRAEWQCLEHGLSAWVPYKWALRQGCESIQFTWEGSQRRGRHRERCVIQQVTSAGTGARSRQRGRGGAVDHAPQSPQLSSGLPIHHLPGPLS